jgi:hypothetical protein
MKNSSDTSRLQGDRRQTRLTEMSEKLPKRQGDMKLSVTNVYFSL